MNIDNIVNIASVSEYDLPILKQKLDREWSHITVARREEIMNAPYPECSRIRNAMTLQQQLDLYHQYGGRNAHDHHNMTKGNSSLT